MLSNGRMLAQMPTTSQIIFYSSEVLRWTGNALTVIAICKFLFKCVDWLRRSPRPRRQAGFAPSSNRPQRWALMGWRSNLALLLLGILLWFAGYAFRFWSDRQLSNEVSSLASDLISFSGSRFNIPQQLPGEEWSQYSQRIVEQGVETQTLYSLKYSGRVIYDRQEFARHGLIDKELDMYYEHPTNPLGIRKVGERLAYLAEELRHHHNYWPLGSQ